ncbi:DUF2270 domain-containing protein [Halorussus rarus]|uniref:DUF2270 domain-containing protein n=1 Tax=Halorussus rarus TaxID=660515 RepID=UPI0013B3EC6E|nr:DUF2270 domain-containing protein [Halorussus rarus]
MPDADAEVTCGEALANRFRRIYPASLGVLLVAWAFRSPHLRLDGIGSRLPESLPFPVSSSGTVATFAAAALAVAFWPGSGTRRRVS